MAATENEPEVIILPLIGLSKRPPPIFRHGCHNVNVCQVHQQLFKFKIFGYNSLVWPNNNLTT